MKNLIFPIITLLILVFNSCQITKGFDREEDLKKYLSKQYGYEINANSSEFVFILNNGRCGTCYQEDLDELSTIFKNNQTRKIILLAKDSPSIISQFEKMPNVRFFLDTENQIGRYGMSYGVDILVLFENGKSTNWTQIKNNKMNYIRNKMIQGNS